MKKWIIVCAIILAVIAIAGGGAYFAYRQHLDNQIIEGAYPSIKNTSLRVSNAIKLMDSRHVTYKEAFEKIDADVAEIDKKLLDVQTASTASTEKWMTAIVGYLRSSQELLRAQSAMFRKQMLASSAVNWAERRFRAPVDSSNSFEQSYNLKARDEAMKDASNALAELRAAGQSVDVALTKLMQSRDTLSSFVPADTLIDTGLIDTARKAVKSTQ